jgi:hypothetical protein
MKNITLLALFVLIHIGILDSVLAQTQHSFQSDLLPTRATTPFKEKNKHTADFNGHSFSDPQSAYASRTPIENLNWKVIPQWESYQQLLQAFKTVQNQRLYNDTEIPSFLRRITWLYPDDGCFQRAAHIAIQFNKLALPKVKQLFIFNHITNNWTYHVAPVARVNGQVYVIDPAMNSNEPIALWRWLNLFTDSSINILSNLCDETTWDPNGNCQKYSFDFNDKDENKSLRQWREEFQILERAKLGENAETQLGNNPPWIYIMRPSFL